MIGVTFKLKNEYSNFLFKIFDKVDIDNFIWYIADNEIIYKDKNNNLKTSIFNQDTMHGTNFLKCIEIEEYYLVYADIKAFNNRIQITNIDTYDDFVNSDCQIALFCTDTIYVELYCKSKIMLGEIIENCKKFGFDELQILTKENDNRTKFSL